MRPVKIVQRCMTVALFIRNISPGESASLLLFGSLLADRLSVQQQRECDEGLISYADLERIPGKIENQCMDLHYDSLDMSDQTFADLSQNKTFEDIPSDVFDKIPRAVTAREERRLVKLQEKLMLDHRASEQETGQPKVCVKA